MKSTKKMWWKLGLVVGIVFWGLSGCQKPNSPTEKPGTEEKKENISSDQSLPSDSEKMPENTVPDTPPAPTREELDVALQEHITQLGELPELKEVDEPIRMTYYFIRALQMKNEKAVLAMLTDKALSERLKRAIPLGPDFLQNADVDLGSVQYLKDEETKQEVGAHVGTTWMIPDPETNQPYEENIAWVFRKEDNTWRVAGMIAVLDPKYPPLLVNFEDVEETLRKYQSIEEEIQQRIENEARQETATETPENETTADAPPETSEKEE